MRALYVFLVLFLISISINAQNFEWLNTYGSHSADKIWANSADPSGGCAFIHSKDGGSCSTDSVSFGSFKFIIGPCNWNNTYFVKLDSSGKVLKARYIGNFASNRMRMCGDSLGNYYISGYLYGDNLFDTLNLKLSNGGIIFAKYDKNLNLVWFTQTGNSKYFYVLNQLGLSISSGRIFFTCLSGDTTRIGTKTYNLTPNGKTYFFGELNWKNGQIKWSNFIFSTSNVVDEFKIGGILRISDKLYLAGDLGNFNVIISKDTIYGPGGFIIETDTLGNYKKRFNFHNKNHLNVSCLTTDGKQLFIGGTFKDSLVWGNKIITPNYPTHSFIGTLKNGEIFAANISTSLKPGWFFHPKVYDSTKYGASYMFSVKHSGGFLYWGGMLRGSFIFDSVIFQSSSDPLIFKTDLRGNVLWATTGQSTKGGYLNTIDAINNRSVYAAGFFSHNIRFGKFSDSSTLTKTFITKITDYSITRGKVSAGPYCAGDTIKVPYTFIGDFDTSNYFVAELSDENGSFNGKYSELGRLKTNKKGTINSILPMFQVASSPNYRIRIRSTKPAIQSYYVYDTLRLLIYSRDKANPGPPETICKGDTIKLNTYGGTKWTWSPKYRMNDNTKRQPLVWPLRDTVYRIIIADSSGCGKPDTAFKKIFIRQELKALQVFKDTSLCENINLKLPVKFVGGDSSYRWNWYYINSPKSFFFLKKGTLKQEDTLSYNSSVDINNVTEKLALVLSDGCASKKDTVYFTIRLKKPISILSNFKDTTLCTGNLLKYKATATGGVPKQYRYQWKDLVSNSILSTTDSLKFLTKKALKIQLIVNDGCEALGDTALFEVKVKAELKAITNLRDTTICAAKPLNYNATAAGGTGKNYKFLWLLNGKQIDTINHLQLTINSSSTLTLITKDNCSSNDTVKKTITVNPSPKADFSWDLACSRTVTKFQFTGTKPNSPITTSFHWNFNNESPSYLENPSYLFTLLGTKKISLVTTASNGCTDTIKKDVVIKPQSKADFTATDVCETDSAVFINKSQDATGYNWKFGDGQTTNLPTTKHKYQITFTTTYNVTLVAQVANGCSDSISKAVTINKNPSSDFSYTYNGTKVDLKITKAGNSYQWKFGTSDSAKTSATTYSHTIKSSDQTKVCLTATDISGCSSQTCKNVSVGILKVLKSDGFKLYPNPNSGSFTIEIENPSKDVSIEIFNLLGERVGKVEKVGKVNRLDLNVADGMYWVRVKNGDSVWNQKVFVQ